MQPAPPPAPAPPELPNIAELVAQDAAAQAQAAGQAAAQAAMQAAHPAIVGNASAPEIYQAFRAQRRELGRQMESLEERRSDLSRQLQDGALNTTDKRGLESRMADVDTRIASLDKQIADADAQVAKAAAIPGAAVEPPPPRRQGPPEEAFVLAGMFMVIILLPLTIAYARRLWRRGVAATTSLPKELMDRLMGLDQAVDAIAVEVERIGEGQRFMTRAFNEQSAPALAIGGTQPIEVKAVEGAHVRR